MLGKIEGKKRRGWQRMRWLDSVTNSMNMNLSTLRKIVEDGGGWCAAVHGVARSHTWLSNWATMTTKESWFSSCKRATTICLIILWEDDEKWVSCHISKQRISQPSAVSHHRWWVAEPWGNSEGKSICYPATIRCSHSLWWALRNSGCENTGYWLQIAEIQYQRNDFNEPRLLHLPIHERALNSLTWNV